MPLGCIGSDIGHMVLLGTGKHTSNHRSYGATGNPT